MFRRLAVVMREEDLPKDLEAYLHPLLSASAQITLLAAFRPPFWQTAEATEELSNMVERLDGALDGEARRLEAAGYPCSHDVLPEELVPARLKRLSAEGVETVVFVSLRRELPPISWTDAVLEQGRIVGWTGRRHPHPLRHVILPYSSHPANALPAALLLRDRTSAQAQVTFVHLSVTGGREPQVEPEMVRTVLGVRAEVQTERLEASLLSIPQQLAELCRAKAADVVLMGAPGLGGLTLSVLLRLFVGIQERTTAPLLILPSLDARLEQRGHLDAPDLLVTGPRIFGKLWRVDPLGNAVPCPSQRVWTFADGRWQGALVVDRGSFVFRPDDPPGMLGLAPSEEEAARDSDSPHPAVRLSAAPMQAPGHIEAVIRLVRHVGRRVALFDAEGELDWVQTHLQVEPARLWCAVRLLPRKSVRVLRERLLELRVDAILDYATVLEEDYYDDVPEQSGPVRLLRVARWLRARGVEVDLVVGGPPARGLLSLSPRELRRIDAAALASWRERVWEPPPEPGDEEGGRRELLGSERLLASRLHVELDNRRHREWLEAQIEAATTSIHLETYIFQEDRAGRWLAERLTQAGARGVCVRVLVDALYSQHGAPLLANSVLQRLSQVPGVEVRSHRPIESVPDLATIKRRNHRKLWIFDQMTASISGRNVGNYYLIDPSEVSLTPLSPYGDVPWLDASVEVEGEVVAALAKCFLEDWRQAGTSVGGPQPRSDADSPLPAPPGAAPAEPDALSVGIPVRFITHTGMEDLYTLETYRTLMDQARSHITVVNTFPLLFELQAALLRALARGVRVRYLVGNIRPLYGEGIPFPGGAVRALAQTIVLGRLGALAAAGAEVHEYCEPTIPGWTPTLHPVRPHVHAKLLSVDGSAFAIGSANLDITSAYWESEALLLIEDAAETRRLDAVLELRLESSSRIDIDSPAWKEGATRREWLSRQWPSVIG